MTRTTRTTFGALALLVATATAVPACGGHDTSFGARAAAAVSTPVSGATEHGHDRGDARSRRVTFTAPNSNAPTVFAPNCDPAQPTICLQPLSLAPAVVSGDLTGTSVTSGATIQRNGTYPSASLVAFTGRAKGCGTGGVLLVVKAAFDPSTLSSRGTWAVYAGTGTAGLSGLTGRGSLSGDAKAFTFTGRIRCR